MRPVGDLRHLFAGSTPTDATGEVVIGEWPAGVFRIEVAGPDGLSGSAEVAVAGEVEAMIRIR